MFANMTHLKVAPESGDQFVSILSSEHLQALLKEAPGFRYNFFLANPAEPGEYYSITFWDSAPQAQGFFSGPGYGEIVGAARDLFIAAPTRWGLEVVEAIDLAGMVAAVP